MNLKKGHHELIFYYYEMSVFNRKLKEMLSVALNEPVVDHGFFSWRHTLCFFMAHFRMLFLSKLTYFIKIQRCSNVKFIGHCQKSIYR